MNRTVLVVDCDPAARTRVKGALAEESIDVLEAQQAVEGLELARDRPPDLLVTELDLPDVTGLGLIRLLRDEPSLARMAVLVLTRFTNEVDRILAFELGVDDYVTKPFFDRELAGRVRAVLRRAASHGRAASPSRVRRLGEVLLDPDARTVTVGEQPVSLTPREFDLLATLMDEPGRVLSRTRLVDSVWGDDAGTGHRSVDTHVKTIRRKLGPGRRYIETVRGVGYRFSER